MYSDHLKAFVPNLDVQQPALEFAPEQYTDARELRALAQLISPYGVKIISERLISMVAGQIIELFKIVRQKLPYALLKGE
jgi:NCK-associated protein 1